MEQMPRSPQSAPSDGEGNCDVTTKEAGVSGSGSGGAESGSGSAIELPRSSGQGSSREGIGNDGGGACAGNAKDGRSAETTSVATRGGMPSLAAPEDASPLSDESTGANVLHEPMTEGGRGWDADALQDAPT
eukprot:g9704.t1